jgi:hypothetical protein
MARAARPRAWDALARFWQSDESLTVLLGLLIFAAFFLPSLAPHDDPRGPLTAALFSAVLLAGVATVLGQQRWAKLAVVALVLVALPIRWAASVEPRGRLAVWSAATETFALALLAIVVLTMVLRPGTITRRRIEGAVAAYLLLGLAWAGAYEWVALRAPSAFAGAIAAGSAPWTYFSFVTLSTMGYGDITPVAPVARSLATAEAITGQLYLAILISRLVALELESRRSSMETPR